ncbi:uncharacterized protein LOC141601268 [Silene latifolia]|uniref:uncharacterized protein LOC141601268 n=1 Tax=Silene latifolia TaxID=37657 RepID=UPI003D77F460
MAMENPFNSETTEINNSISATSSMEATDPLYLHPAECAHPLAVDTKLSGIENYLEWKGQMEIAICSRRKLGFLTGVVKRPTNDPLKEAAWDTCNSLLISWIFHNVEQPIKKSVLYTRTTKDIWKYLEKQFSPPVTQVTPEIKAWLDAQIKEQEERKLFQFLNRLHPSYSTMRSNVLMMSPLPTVEEAAAMFQYEEAQRRNYKLSEKMEVDNSTFYAGSGSGQKETEIIPVPSCSACNKKGHTRDKCWRVIGYPADHPVSKRFPEKSQEYKLKHGYHG